MFDFEADPPPSQPPRRRFAALSRTFAVMVGLALAALAALAFLLFWTLKVMQNT
ncbi:hypothetical protein ACTOB_005468 [Actinoplanes oblitus]|uniref:Uncharacterized protein n=1 Tax=Actinoplanes oblitus TaxID=3040509 RepID=A0ABY8W742_9ACTN|nr:hypothetical protein [Actinoplanes oblitus]WIM93488.1 hypothetical protein ACTOB_005468 [Actinoplanes oblitus]